MMEAGLPEERGHHRGYKSDADREAMNTRSLDFAFLREQIVGIDSTFRTPFGERLMVYCDYTASGRCLDFIERYLMRLQRHYANTHTEDDLTGRNMTSLLRQAEQSIKDSGNAGPGGRIIAYGAGCTATIYRFQQMVGVAFPPVTRHLLFSMINRFIQTTHGEGKGSRQAEMERALEDFLTERQPVVFIGSYEHHSNELTWRDGLATVVPVDMDENGGLDLAHLEELLKAPEYQDRLRIGAFSAASNVTGLLTPVHDVARLLHRHIALASFDYAACAPYVEIDMNPPAGPEGGDPSLDAIFISPHKFVGGPGSTGVLVFNERIYHHDMGPTISGGGTVSYVNPVEHDFYSDIEEREKPGTPGVLQTLKASLVFQIKSALSVDRIEARELELVERAFARWKTNPQLELLGDPDPRRRVAIISFNIKDPWGSYLHPKFTTVLLNDLFGLQTRAGCACAGPFGHYLLDIDMELSNRYRKVVEQGYLGLKPGWCRLGFHFTMDDVEADYIIDTVDFVARHGHMFLPFYTFDPKGGHWTHKEDVAPMGEFSLESALDPTDDARPHPLPPDIRAALYQTYLDQAHRMAQEQEATAPEVSDRLEGELGELQFFSMLATSE